MNVAPWSIIKVSGEAAATFLQGQLTCDVNRVTEQRSSLAALCNHQGRVLALMLLFRKNGHFFCFLPNCLAEFFRVYLHKYAVFSKVILEDVTSEFFSYQLTCDAKISSPLVFQELPTETYQVENNSDGLCITAFPGRQYRYIIWGPKVKQASLLSLIEAYKVNDDHWKKDSILSGIPSVFHKTSGLFTPHMLNLHLLDAVCFKKGCYVGQEIIARTQYLGKAKRHLYRANLEGCHTIHPGDALTVEGQVVGTVVESTQEKNNSLFLAVLQEASIGQPILCEGELVRNIKRYSAQG